MYSFIIFSYAKASYNCSLKKNVFKLIRAFPYLKKKKISLPQCLQRISRNFKTFCVVCTSFTQIICIFAK